MSEKEVKSKVKKAVAEKAKKEFIAANKNLSHFVKVMKVDIRRAEYTRGQMIQMFLDGIRFAQTWKKGPAKLDEDKLVFIYNPEADDYDVSWYDKVGEETFYAYLEQLMPKRLYAKIVERQIRDDMAFSEEQEKAY